MSGDRQTLQERADRLRARLDDGFPEAWIPQQEGDEIVGIFRRLEQAHLSNYGLRYVAIFEEPVSGREFAVWLFHKALRTELSKLRPQVGELVAVRWLGKKQPQSGGKPYDAYRVTIERSRVAEQDWDRLGVAPAGEPDDGVVLPHPVADEAVPEVCAECGAYLAVGPHEIWCSRA